MIHAFLGICHRPEWTDPGGHWLLGGDTPKRCLGVNEINKKMCEAYTLNDGLEKVYPP